MSGKRKKRYELSGVDFFAFRTVVRLSLFNIVSIQCSVKGGRMGCVCVKGPTSIGELMLAKVVREDMYIPGNIYIFFFFGKWRLLKVTGRRIGKGH